MSTATIDSTPQTSTPSTSSSSRRTSSAGNATNRRRSEQHSRDQFETSFVSTELAVSELVRGSVTAARALLPGFVTRPTDAVDYVFDLAGQGLAASRRLAYEFAALVESGFEGLEREAA